MNGKKVINTSSANWEIELRLALFRKEQVDLIKPGADPNDIFLNSLAVENKYAVSSDGRARLSFRPIE